MGYKCAKPIYKNMKNLLSQETSPYLLQHAHNPVHWQPWGQAALQLAKELDKPILVSIGYSACHWCHVMERESFENDATAAIMNEYFINIKIDREERPDIDHIYMDAVQAITGSGGWPLNVFLTPDGKPFYGGTYFPPVQAHGRASWPDVLVSINRAWQERRAEMEEQAENLMSHLKKSNNFGLVKNNINIETGKQNFTKEDIETITKNLLANADVIEGGFGKAPKFPQTFSINCLLQAAHFSEDKNALLQAELSLTKMLHGGIYDQLAGGLCRYSTDAEWLAPHFEKMLYDNALFITTLSNAFLLTKKDIYKNAINHICNFLFAEMKNPTGGYYAAIDADSEGVEGKFYVWDKNEIDTILGEDAALYNQYYDVTEHGNWEEKNILRILQPLEDVAKNFNMDIAKAENIIGEANKKLLQVRNKRIRPSTDDKILLGWNALLITAFCKAFAATQNELYKEEAIALCTFIEDNFANENTFYHTYKNGQAKYPAFLDDYAYLIEAYIHLQEITAEENYLSKAKKITALVFDKFFDEESGYFFFTTKEQTDVVIRKIEMYDGATPSANAVMAKNIYYLSIVFDKQAWKDRAITMIDSLKTIITKHPSSFGIWAAQAMNMCVGINEIAIIGTDKTPLLNETLLEYIPNKILQASNSLSDMPLLAKKTVIEKTLLYLCFNFECKTPVESTKGLLEALKNKLK
jgi:uncharacterized protein